MNPHATWWLYLVPILVGWVTLALVNANLAQGKDRRGGVWFLLSLVLGPLATLALTFLPRARRRLF
ncbi:MAG TPA: antitermination protein NusB [Rhodanobacteraceae bacterium]